MLAFQGSKRRLEYIGELQSGAFVYDDYAHHPTEIQKTLQALRKQFPKKKIIVIFQPHTFSRTKKLLEEFSTSFKEIDLVILTDIYASLREAADDTISSRILTEKISGKNKDAIYLSQLSDVVKYINENRLRSDTVLVTMGAGDVYKIHSELKFA